jgi:hypothetical protein
MGATVLDKQPFLSGYRAFTSVPNERKRIMLDESPIYVTAYRQMTDILWASHEITSLCDSLWYAAMVVLSS